MKHYLIPLGIASVLLVVGAACSSKTSNTNAAANTNSSSDFTNTSLENSNSSANDNVNGSDQTVNTNATTAPMTVNVSMSNFSFVPNVITVKQGGTVTFTNDDSTGHTVQVDGGTDHPVASGAAFALDASTLSPGNHTLRCTLHPSMTGTITVVQP